MYQSSRDSRLKSPGGVGRRNRSFDESKLISQAHRTNIQLVFTSLKYSFLEWKERHHLSVGFPLWTSSEIDRSRSFTSQNGIHSHRKHFIHSPKWNPNIIYIIHSSPEEQVIKCSITFVTHSSRYKRVSLIAFKIIMLEYGSSSFFYVTAKTCWRCVRVAKLGVCECCWTRPLSKEAPNISVEQECDEVFDSESESLHNICLTISSRGIPELLRNLEVPRKSLPWIPQNLPPSVTRDRASIRCEIDCAVFEIRTLLRTC